MDCETVGRPICYRSQDAEDDRGINPVLEFYFHRELLSAIVLNTANQRMALSPSGKVTDVGVPETSNSIVLHERSSASVGIPAAAAS